MNHKPPLHSPTPARAQLMKPSLLHILQHSLGCDKYGVSTVTIRDENDGCFGYYRNRFVTDPSCDDGKDCVELVQFGFMRDHGPQAIAGGMHCYCVTEAGIKVMRENSPVPPKLTRSQKRWRRYRECADCFENFRAFLRYENHKEREARY